MLVFNRIHRYPYIPKKMKWFWKVCDRICRTCNVTEDEIHFLLNCVEYGKMQDNFYAKVKNRYVDFIGLNDNEKYSFLMTNADPYILVWLGKFIYHIFIKRNEIQWNPSRATPSRAATPLVRPYFQAPLYFSYISFKCQPLMNSHPTNLVRGQWFWFQPPLTSSHSAAARSGQPWNSWLIWLWAHRHTC